MARNTPIPKTQVPETVRREQQISRRDDDVADQSIGIYDIDAAIKFYFDTVIKPGVIEADTRVSVPVMYGSPERWASAKKRGFMRDKKGKIQVPVIVYKRTNTSKDDAIPVDKLDANNPHLFYTAQKRWSERNRYSNFAILQGQRPVPEFHQVIVPDYVVVSYDVIMWTEYLDQMNSLIESMIYSEGSYWGDPNRFKFRCSFTDISDATEVSSNTDRSVKSTFSMTVRGYLIPSTYNAQIAQGSKRKFGYGKIITMTEVDGRSPADPGIVLEETTVSDDD